MGVPTGFRRLALASVVATFALIVLGGVVRVSESGLGCGPAGSGLRGWPLCDGQLLPGLDVNSVIEYAHRALGSVVGLLVLGLVFVAWRRLRESHRRVYRTSVAAAGLVVAQGLLGAGVVERGLQAELVAAHLALAMVFLALLLDVLREASPPAAGPAEHPDRPPGAPGRGSRLLAVAAPVAVLLTIVAGGYVAGTENQGRVDSAQTVGAHYACGAQFPLCNGRLAPFGQGELVDAHLTHRALMYLSALLVVALALLVLRGARPRARRLAVTSLGLLAAQILVGALNVWIAEKQPALIVGHLLLATLLWSSLIGLRAALAPASEPPPVHSRGAEAVAA